MNTYVSALVASWEYERFLALVREYLADQTAMDVLEDVLGGGEGEGGNPLDDDDDDDGAVRGRGGREQEDFSAFM